MIDVSAMAVMNVAATSVPATQTVVPVAPDGLAVSQFQNLMNAAPAPSDVAAAGAGAIPAAAVPPSQHAFNLGDKILSGLGQMGDTMKSSIGEIDAALRSSANLGTADLLRAQLNVVQFSLQMDYVGKMFGGVTRSIDQLSKVQ
ncbi:EscI/YscI/HrpB family type III secretion system inner rod protein [Noviherbaspirillum sp. CPCC 100848]|uniref:EscI/YscI/HrpB family type III secretion system inner rod protein n=1 Tax=Noviherbaspirillum album TaxID=3080276 RepID=A0ABU6JAP8_9BURK|nr:EscI/YscI/HrpB family type III secretion system inner rod protein [Noviherbaspirillum sp. CPCC 100848]MEC4720729.1 EscI/YscI/HrpB family type III secretion system inner rod protein [Noviherbaspirillum sp. CPCC 100848]